MQRIDFKVLVAMLLLMCAQTRAIRINHITRSPQSVARACADLQEAIGLKQTDTAYAIAHRLAKLGCRDDLMPYMTELDNVLAAHNIAEIRTMLDKKQHIATASSSKKMKKVPAAVTVTASNKSKPSQSAKASKGVQHNYNDIFDQWCALQQHQAEELELRAAHIVTLEQELASVNKRAEQLESALQFMKESTVDANDLRSMQATLVMTQQRAQKVEESLRAANEDLQQQLQKTQHALRTTREQLEIAAARPQVVLSELAREQTKNAALWKQLAELNKESEGLCVALRSSKSEALACMDAKTELEQALMAAQQQSEQQHAMYKDMQDQLANVCEARASLEQEYQEYRAHNNPECFHLFLADMKRVAREKMTNLCTVIDNLHKDNDSIQEQFAQERAELIAECESYEQHLERVCQEMEQGQAITAAKCTDLEQQCELLAQNNEELQQVCQQLRAAMDDCLEENKELAEMYQAERDHGMQQAVHIAELAETLSHSEEESQQLVCRYKDLMSAHCDLQVAMEEQEGENEGLLAALTKVQAELQQEKDLQRDKHNDYVALCEQFNECKQEQMTLAQLYQREQKESELKSGHIADLTVRLQQTQDKMVSLNQLLSTHEQQTQQLYAELEESTQKYETMEYQCKKLITEIERQQQGAEQMDNQRCQRIAVLEESLREQACVKDGLNHELTVAREQLAQTARQLEEQTHASAALAEELHVTQEMKAQELEYSHACIADLTSTLEREKQGHERMRADYEKAELEIASLGERLQTCVQAYRTEKERNNHLALEAKAGLSRAMHVAQKKVRSLEQQHKMLCKELEQAQETQAQLQQRISDKDDHSTQLARALEDSHQHIANLEQQLAAYVETTHKMEMQFASVQAIVNEPEENTEKSMRSKAEVVAAA